ncbi:MAG TPA: hypothetical protein VNW94_06405 [Streptosporangiaceae bacterium]|nr:hypothetical protein [Streptosporangiaceae bacterium]
MQVAALLHDSVEDHPVELAGEGHGDATEAPLDVLAHARAD